MARPYGPAPMINRLVVFSICIPPYRKARSKSYSGLRDRHYHQLGDHYVRRLLHGEGNHACHVLGREADAEFLIESLCALFVTAPAVDGEIRLYHPGQDLCHADAGVSKVEAQ